MALLNKLKEITEIVRKGKVELTREEVLELSDIVRYIPDKNRGQVYDYLLENDPLLAHQVEKETMDWLADFFQNAAKIQGHDGNVPKNLH